MKKIIFIIAIVIFTATIAIANDEIQLDSLSSEVLDTVSIIAIVDDKIQRIDRNIGQVTFINKGQFMFGAAFSYKEQTNENFKFLVLDKIEAVNYSFKVSPVVSYFFKDNISAGGRVAYARGYTDLGNISLALGDLGFDLSNYKEKSHNISVDGFLRVYLPLLGSKRIGLFNEVRVTYGYGQSRTENGLGEDMVGIHQTIHNLNFGLAPGLICFMDDFVAVEVAIDVLGLDFKWYDQTTNQVETGKRTSSGANFKLNLLSINMGIVFYL